MGLRQLLPGRDIALQPTSQYETLVFGAAKNMKNFIYLVGCLHTRECYAIDAAWDIRGIVAAASRHKMKLIGSIASHYHFDHVGGLVSRELQGMVFGPFGTPKGMKPVLCGLAEMGRDHGCKMFAHSLEVDRIAKQIEMPSSSLSPLEQGQRLPVGQAAEL